MATTILIFEDDPVQRRLLSAALARLGYHVEAADRLSDIAGPRDLDESRRIVAAVVALDGGQTKSAALSAVSRLARSVPVIVQVPGGSLDAVSDALDHGAVDFVTTPVSMERLRVSIGNAMRTTVLECELGRVRRRNHGRFSFDDLVAVSPAMDKVIKLGRRAAATRDPVMLEGERGVGKALLAGAIHGGGERRSKPFVVVDCSILTEANAVQLLFGENDSRAARSRSSGRIGETHGGTLFLDGVDHLPFAAQLPLLNALRQVEDGAGGSRKRLRGDFRLISAASSDLLERVRRGALREDLYYRLNVLPIRVPPLRERPEDVPELARHLIARFAAEEGKTFLMGLDEAALALLVRHGWSGNVAELESAVFHAVALADGPFITPREFPRLLSADSGAFSQHQASLLRGGNERRSKGDQPGLPAFDRRGDIRQLADMEAEVIRLAVERYGGRMTMVARKLGIGRSTLYRKLRDLGLLDSDVRTAAE